MIAREPDPTEASFSMMGSIFNVCSILYPLSQANNADWSSPTIPLHMTITELRNIAEGQAPLISRRRPLVTS
jgi:hypothetical protein